MKKTIVALLILSCLFLSACGQKVQEEEAQVGYKPPEVVDGAVQTGQKEDLVQEEVTTQKGDNVTVKDYSKDFPVVTGKNEFTVLNLNLNNQNGTGDQSYAVRNKALIELLLQQNPDVITFQEVGSDWMDYIVPQLQDIYDYYLIYPNKEDKSTANPIFYKLEKFTDSTGGCFWISDTPDTESAAADGKYYNCTWLQLQEKATGNNVYVFNAQLGAEISEKAAAIVRSKCESIGWRKPIVCNLDLGTTLDTPAGKHLLDNLENANTQNNTTPTSYALNSQGAVHDFSLYTKVTLTPKSYSVISRIVKGKLVSDHSPMVTHYTWNTENLNYQGQFIF